VTRAIRAEFRYVRAYGSIEGWGFHFLASNRPLPVRSSADLTARMPPAAIADLVEWAPDWKPGDIVQVMVAAEQDLAELAKSPIELPMLTDDHPTNEYFALRKLRFSLP